MLEGRSVGLTEVSSHDLVIVGSGIAGLRAAIEATSVSKGKCDIAVITKVQAMRSHSVSGKVALQQFCTLTRATRSSPIFSIRSREATT